MRWIYVKSKDYPAPPQLPLFNSIECGVCGKSYSNFKRDIYGFPLYFKIFDRKKLTFDTIEEYIDAVEGIIKVKWLCSPECALNEYS